LNSLWIETAPATRPFPSLEDGAETDVAVLGAGVTGLTTALLLKEAGLRVAVVEAERVAMGATAHSTVKVTAGHGLLYSELVRRFDVETARVYAEANVAGLAEIVSMAERLGIDCDLERRPNHVWAESAVELESLRAESLVERELGLPTTLLDAADELPFEVTGLLRMEDQAQFHPRRFLLGLAAAIDGDGSSVFEHARAHRVDERDDGCVVGTPAGSIRARHVVVATQYPFLNRGFFFAKLYPHREYAIAVRSEPGRLRGMYINSGSPTRSLRQAADAEGELLVVVGEGHKVGEEGPTEGRYLALQDWATTHFGTGEARYRWSTQDPYSMDRLPFVGRITRSSRRVWLATGYGTWGITNAAAAAMMLRDAILERANPWAGVFDAQRLTPRQSGWDFARENTKVAGHFVGDRVRALLASAEGLQPGEGRVVKDWLKPVAVARDDDGELHAVSATCTHLGCLVAWNGADRSWDCPCHGSRFGMDGEVLHAPAVEPLAPVDFDVEEKAEAPEAERPGSAA
jgi:glycine/D-amino acid oxidase-like deaminating enzyme/nitrite reductase/ring-hydroxylating ferredoxin subunit